MPYIDFKALVKKVNLKPKGVKEIVLEVNGSDLDGKLDKLSEMIDQYSEVQLESLIVNYNITINAKTNEPIKQYKVDQNGLVQEMKNENEQIEANLGFPKEKAETKEEKKEIEREPIDQFILEGLAPNFDDFPDDFANIVKRRLDGESYSKLASELEISSGKIVDMIDEFRKRIAPLAQPWWEWKQQDQEHGSVADKKFNEIPTDSEAAYEKKETTDEEDEGQGGAA